MSEISAKLVKELRDRTDAPMMECKKALVQTNGDIELAIEELQKSGKTKAAKKAGRIAAEGVVSVRATADNQYAVMIEINSETDFVARDSNFTEFTDAVTRTALETKVTSLESLVQSTLVGTSETVDAAQQNLIAKIGENINVRRIKVASGKHTVGVYSHGGRIGVLVEIDIPNTQLAKDIAMHVAATNPEVILPEEMPQERLAKEKAIYVEQAAGSGKPADIIEKMVQGRLQKFKAEHSLVGQPFVKNPDQTVGDLLKASGAKVIAFTRFEVGEGIEKQVTDFAAEVMAQVNG